MKVIVKAQELKKACKQVGAKKEDELTLTIYQVFNQGAPNLLILNKRTNTEFCVPTIT